METAAGREQRRIEIRERMVQEGKLLRITTVEQGIAYGDGWQRAYSHLEAAHTLALAQLAASDLLLRIANEELERLRRLTACA